MNNLSRREFLAQALGLAAAAAVPACTPEYSSPKFDETEDLGTPDLGTPDAAIEQCGDPSICEITEAGDIESEIMLSFKERIDAVLDQALAILEAPYSYHKEARPSQGTPWWHKGIYAETGGDFTELRMNCDQNRSHVIVNRVEGEVGNRSCKYYTLWVKDLEERNDQEMLTLSEENDPVCAETDNYGGPMASLKVNCAQGATLDEWDNSGQTMIISETPVTIQEADALTRYVHARINEIVQKYGISNVN